MIICKIIQCYIIKEPTKCPHILSLSAPTIIHSQMEHISRHHTFFFLKKMCSSFPHDLVKHWHNQNPPNARNKITYPFPLLSSPLLTMFKRMNITIINWKSEEDGATKPMLLVSNKICKLFWENNKLWEKIALPYVIWGEKYLIWLGPWNNQNRLSPPSLTSYVINNIKWRKSMNFFWSLPSTSCLYGYCYLHNSHISK